MFRVYRLCIYAHIHIYIDIDMYIYIYVCSSKGVYVMIECVCVFSHLFVRRDAKVGVSALQVLRSRLLEPTLQGPIKMISLYQILQQVGSR